MTRLKWPAALLLGCGSLSFLWGCCPPAVPAAFVQAEAHAVATNTLTAMGDLAMCQKQPDAGACATVNQDLCKVMAKAVETEALALDAGLSVEPDSSTSAVAASASCP